MRKIAARWVPCLLTRKNRSEHVTTLKERLALCNRNPNDHLTYFSVVKETWIFHNSPEIKQQLTQHRVSHSESALKYIEVGQSAKQGYDDCFLACMRNSPHRLPSKGSPVNSEYYIN